MKILFINSFYYIPQSTGGLARTLQQLAKGLQARGHETLALVELRNQRNAFTFTRKVRMKVAKILKRPATTNEKAAGLRVLRCWRVEEVVESVVRRERPDVIVVTGGRVVPIVRILRNCGAPIVLQVHDVETEYHAGDFSEVADLPCVANSEFTAAWYDERFGTHCEVVLPFMDLSEYKVTQPGSSVLFVHPVAKKGVEKAVAIVKACPEIPFTFVGAQGYEAEMSSKNLPPPETLPNLELLPFLSDMRDAYKKARILIVPSQWEEAYGRVVNEAQVSGIPAIVSSRGGLPEAVARGGIVLPAESSAEEWSETLQSVWHDENLYSELSEAAFDSVSRKELSSAHQLGHHETIMRRAAENWAARLS